MIQPREIRVEPLSTSSEGAGPAGTSASEASRRTCVEKGVYGNERTLSGANARGNVQGVTVHSAETLSDELTRRVLASREWLPRDRVQPRYRFRILRLVFENG